MNKENFKRLMTRILVIFTILSLLGACSPVAAPSSDSATASKQSIPRFDHIVIITFENQKYAKIINILICQP